MEPRLQGSARADPGRPLLLFGLFRDVSALSGPELDAALAGIGPPPPLEDLRQGHDAQTHGAKVRTILDLIRAGEVYQVNLTFPLEFQFTGNPLSLYAALRTRQPVAHGGVVALGETTVLSVSPELFVEIAGDLATTRPMKGTTGRGADPAGDRDAARDLAADPKQRAENLMIVDLLRNDLARICKPGSVRTPARFTVETYPGFHALTSTVTGRLRPGTGLRERLAALFPCGSVVGAPKIRAAEIIAEIEEAPRGPYTGSIGWISPGGDMAFNVAIRTAVIGPDGFGVYGVGGGIVADSDPAQEYAEALLKGRVLTDLAAPYSLIETLRWTPEAGFVRLERHLDRLRTSARQLGFPCDPPEIAAELSRRVSSWRPADQRVRVQLARDGELHITAVPLEPPLDRVLRIGLATETLDAADPFLRHKTTVRASHERAMVSATSTGLDEVILLNRSGRVADAARHTVFLARDGRLLTPPVTSGALPGVLRATLLASGEALEADLSADDLVTGQVYLGNSLRGMQPAQLRDR